MKTIINLELFILASNKDIWTKKRSFCRRHINGYVQSRHDINELAIKNGLFCCSFRPVFIAYWKQNRNKIFDKIVIYNTMDMKGIFNWVILKFFLCVSFCDGINFVRDGTNIKLSSNIHFTTERFEWGRKMLIVLTKTVILRFVSKNIILILL